MGDSRPWTLPGHAVIGDVQAWLPRAWASKKDLKPGPRSNFGLASRIFLSILLIANVVIHVSLTMCRKCHGLFVSTEKN
jgi:hypothetical protein